MNKGKKDIIFEMKEHLNHILFDINNINFDNKNIYQKDNIETIKLMIIDLINQLKTEKDLFLIDLDRLKKISNMVYDLNFINEFSIITDHISNELYAFEFLLQEWLKRKDC